MGVSGSACEYGGVLLQIDPFAPPARIEEMLGAEWTADIAYFRDNAGEWGRPNDASRSGCVYRDDGTVNWKLESSRLGFACGSMVTVSREYEPAG